MKENGLLIIPSADDMLAMAREQGWIRDDVKIAYVATDAETLPKEAFGTACAGDIAFEKGKIRFTAKAGFGKTEEVPLSLSVIGKHHVGNALVGLLAGLYLDIPSEKVAEGISSFSQIGHREKLVDVNGVCFLDDSYNAGPESMMSGMSSIRRLTEGGRAFACIGDMLELGDVSAEKHFEIGAHAAKEHLDGLFVIGDFKEDVKKGAASVDPSLNVVLCEDKEEILEKLKNTVQAGDFVLLKASHSFEMYTILEEYASIFKEEEC